MLGKLKDLGSRDLDRPYHQLGRLIVRLIFGKAFVVLEHLLMKPVVTIRLCSIPVSTNLRVCFFTRGVLVVALGLTTDVQIGGGFGERS